MSMRTEKFAVGEFYHLYNRGNDKRKIFMNAADYKRFIFLMFVCNSVKNIKAERADESFDREETLVDIGAYCLMPNHFHILVHEKIEGGVSKFMLKLMTAYSMYFNKKYERTGKLYEGPFKAKLAANDQYLKYLYSYIHLNPAKLLDKNWKTASRVSKEKLLKYIFDYKYSSITEYVEDSFQILNSKPFPRYFNNIVEHKKELFEWLSKEI